MHVENISILWTGLEKFPNWIFAEYSHVPYLNFDNNQIKEISDNVKS